MQLNFGSFMKRVSESKFKKVNQIQEKKKIVLLLIKSIWLDKILTLSNEFVIVFNRVKEITDNPNVTRDENFVVTIPV